MKTIAVNHAQIVPVGEGRFLKREHCTLLLDGIASLDQTIRLTSRMEDRAMGKSIIEKLEAKKLRMLESYGEFRLPSGEVLVRHPGIAYLLIETKPLNEPRRLFASQVKSLSSTVIRLFKADALISTSRNVSYVNRTLVLEVEMSQAAFAKMLTNAGRGVYPMTIRNMEGVEVTFEGDLREKQNKLMLDSTQNLTMGLQNHLTEMQAMLNKVSEKGGVMSMKARSEISFKAGILDSWAASNPDYKARVLAEHSDAVTSDVQLEILFLAQMKG